MSSFFEQIKDLVSISQKLELFLHQFWANVYFLICLLECAKAGIFGICNKILSTTTYATNGPVHVQCNLFLLSKFLISIGCPSMSKMAQEKHPQPSSVGTGTSKVAVQEAGRFRSPY
jgi:hypothetical protein